MQTLDEIRDWYYSITIAVQEQRKGSSSVANISGSLRGVYAAFPTCEGVRRYNRANGRNEREWFMSSNFRLIVAVVVTIIIMFIGMSLLFRHTVQAPPTPIIADADTITITLYPLPDLGVDGSKPITIPKQYHNRIMDFLKPGQPYSHSGSINEFMHTLIARVELTHTNGPKTLLLVRWSGKNPALISVDGRHYYYGASTDEIYDGAIQLRSLVDSISKNQ